MGMPQNPPQRFSNRLIIGFLVRTIDRKRELHRPPGKLVYYLVAIFKLQRLICRGDRILYMIRSL
jgi:hypothetical protein